MIGNRPRIKLRHPSADQIPSPRIIRLDAGLGQQFGCCHAGLVDIGLPQCGGKGETFLQRAICAPLIRQFLDLRHAQAQIGAVNLVIGLCFDGALRVGYGLQLGKGCFDHSPDHSTVTDFARLRGWSTSVPLAMAV